MKQLLLSLLLLAVGGILGATVVIIGRFEGQPSETWTARTRLSTESGIVIPAGTELRLLSDAPGDAETLELFLQIGAQDRAAFERDTDVRAHLVVPYRLRPDMP